MKKLTLLFSLIALAIAFALPVGAADKIPTQSGKAIAAAPVATTSKIERVAAKSDKAKAGAKKSAKSKAKKAGAKKASAKKA